MLYTAKCYWPRARGRLMETVWLGSPGGSRLGQALSPSGATRR
jgi:hypothetical protein